MWIWIDALERLLRYVPVSEVLLHRDRKLRARERFDQKLFRSEQAGLPYVHLPVIGLNKNR